MIDNSSSLLTQQFPRKTRNLLLCFNALLGQVCACGKGGIAVSSLQFHAVISNTGFLYE
jgi:hypothetical protein